MPAADCLERPGRKRLLLWLIPAAIVIALIVLLALGAGRLMDYRRNCRAAERVAELGGRCDWETRELPWPFPLLGKEWSTVRVGIRAIFLSGTPVADEDLAHIAKLTSMERLNLRGTQITDAGLACVSGLTGLVYLDLSGTQVTDAGLAHVAKLTSLRHLYLNNSQVTDAGLAHLSGLANMGFLYLLGTQVTDAGVAALKKALPKLHVYH